MGWRERYGAQSEPRRSFPVPDATRVGADRPELREAEGLSEGVMLDTLFFRERATLSIDPPLIRLCCEQLREQRLRLLIKPAWR